MRRIVFPTLLLALVIVFLSRGEIAKVWTPAPAVTLTPVSLITDLTDVYAEPSLAAEILGQYDPNARYILVGRTADSAWWQVRYNDVDAWLYSDHLGDLVKAEDVPVTWGPMMEAYVAQKAGSDYATVYTEPSIESAVVGFLEAGQKLEIIGRLQSAQYVYLQFGGCKRGWAEMSDWGDADNFPGVPVITPAPVATPMSCVTPSTKQGGVP